MTDQAQATPPSKGAIAALLLAIAGAGIMVWGFLAGIDSALNGSGNGAGPFVVLFFVGAALDLLALAIAVVGIAKRRSTGVSIVALIVCLLPVAAVIVLALRARG